MARPPRRPRARGAARPPRKRKKNVSGTGSGTGSGGGAKRWGGGGGEGAGAGAGAAALRGDLGGGRLRGCAWWGRPRADVCAAVLGAAVLGGTVLGWGRGDGGGGWGWGGGGGLGAWRVVDISAPLGPGTPMWQRPSPAGAVRTELMTAGEGSPPSDFTVSFIHVFSHAGTHIDAPKHALRGAGDLLSLPLGLLNGPAFVLNVPDGAQAVGREELAAAFPRAPVPERLLLRTRHSREGDMRRAEFQSGYVALDQSAAEWAVENGVKLVGVDYLSAVVEADIVQGHHTLLGGGVVLLEGLDLLLPGEDLRGGGGATLLCLPLPIEGADGAPTRAALAFPNSRRLAPGAANFQLLKKYFRYTLRF